MVKWSDVCKPIDQGGLGACKLQDHNYLYLLKLGLNLVMNTEALWVKILRNKDNVFGIIPESLFRNRCSLVWKSIVGVWSDVKKRLVWSVRNGLLVNFWNDN